MCRRATEGDPHRVLRRGRGWRTTLLDFGTAAIPIPLYFFLLNEGGTTVDLSDGMTLAPPFAWTAGGAYPGGSGIADGGAGATEDGLSFCSSSLAPSTFCALAITYSAASSAQGRVTLDLTGAYLPTLTRELAGTATDRARLTLSDDPSFSTCTDSSCAPADVGVNFVYEVTAALNLFVRNQGALPVTVMAQGTPLSPPFAWGDAGFPGGSGSLTLDGASYPYCATPLEVGAQCVVTVIFAPPDGGTYPGAANIAYSDAVGPVSPDANRDLQGTAGSWLP